MFARYSLVGALAAAAGALFAASYRAWPLVICGALKITYDVLLDYAVTGELGLAGRRDGNLPG